MALTISTEDLTRELDAMPAQQAVALRVLHVSGDPRSSAADLASALMADPAMTAQVIRMANSAYYGLSGRVGSIPFAVTVIGFETIRSLVAAFAAGALGQEAEVPDRFWERSSATAAASSILAPRVEAPQADAFSLGLLHELGDFLLFRSSPEAHAEAHAAAEPWDCFRRCRVERALFGIDHSQVLARCLRAWSFPEEFAEAVESHADASRISPPLGRCLAGATALGPVSMYADEDRRTAAELVSQLTRRFEVGGLQHDQVWGLSRQARHDAATLAASFTTA